MLIKHASSRFGFVCLWDTHSKYFSLPIATKITDLFSDWSDHWRLHRQKSGIAIFKGGAAQFEWHPHVLNTLVEAIAERDAF